MNECKSIFIEDADLKDGVVTFTMLCDSAIIKIDVSQRAELVINTRHSFWDNPDNKLLVKITQPDNFVNQTDELTLEIELRKEDGVNLSTPYASGAIVLVVMAIASGLVMRFAFSE